MRKILILCAVSLVVAGLLVWRSVRLPTRYGEFIGAKQATVDELLSHPQDFAGKTVSVQAVVRDQPNSMRCHFFFSSTQGRLRVELNGITDDAPNRNGRPARVEGQLMPFNDGYQLYATAVDFRVR